MPRFSSPVSQAASVIKELQGDTIKSVGTARNYEQALTRVAEYVKAEKLGSLREMTPQAAVNYLEIRGQEVGQKTLDMERQAIQCMMQNVTEKLSPTDKLAFVQSEHQQALSGRAYTPEQVQAIVSNQTERNALATEIAHAAGLRAHELHTLQRIEERAPSDRPAHEGKFTNREGERYTVKGKGGLVREVVIPRELANRLEERRFDAPQKLTDRGINYQSLYDISGGNKWSSSFNHASNKALGWSTGAHGVRHSYVQQRMEELKGTGHNYREALTIVSQEVGHFRPEITEVYLR